MINSLPTDPIQEAEMNHFHNPFSFILSRTMTLLMIFILLFPNQISFAKNYTPDIVAQEQIYIATDSQFPQKPPIIDGIASSQEWASAASMPLNIGGALMVMNDYVNIYFLIDVTSDTHADAIGSATGDYFRLTFDSNLNKNIDSGVDIMYSLFPNSETLCFANYTGPGSTTPCYASDSSVKPGFGTTPNSSIPHRFYELAISRAEISPSAATSPLPALPVIYNDVYIGLMIFSNSPYINYSLPANHQTDFSDLLPINLDAPRLMLLMLSHPDYLAALQPLKEHKDYTDLPSFVMDWQQVAKAYGKWGRDDPERIKKALAIHENNTGLLFAMLVGDSNRFPMRYTVTDRDDPNADWAFYSADLYYADLYEYDKFTFEDWDANHDGYFGELHGEQITGIVNVDAVDTDPDIAVGRVPAENASEVTTFVNKVINYETNAYQADWAKKALMIATTDFVSDACKIKNQIADPLLSSEGYTSIKLYQTPNPCEGTDPPTSANINETLNKGVNFVNYYGHGSLTSWGIPADAYDVSDLTGLTNSDKLFTAVSGGCDTAQYATQPPYDAYTDIDGVNHKGTKAGEVFLTKPVQPAPIQTVNNPEPLMESMLVKTNKAAVGYVGFVTGSQDWGLALDEFFYEALTDGNNTLGWMWNYMVRQYYVTYPIPAYLSPTNWTIVAGVHQPWKFHLFGDPSLRINGVSTFQMEDFSGYWSQNHDGWKGALSLKPVFEEYIESIPNMDGDYFPAAGGDHKAYGFVRTWFYPIPVADTWPDYMMRFFIDFADTTSTSDDQRFEGYLFTHNREIMAGLTWWGGIPYGFYSTKNSGITGASIGYESPSAPTVLAKSDFLGKYFINHDGWQGRLELIGYYDTAGQPNITGSYVDSSGMSHLVRGYVRTSTYDLPPDWGPDHKIVFFIDLPNTPTNPYDDQLFEGYLFTHTKQAMAGITYWYEQPFGFYAVKEIPTYLPFIRK